MFLDATGLSANDTGLGNYILLLLRELAKEPNFQFTALCNPQGFKKVEALKIESLNILQKNIHVFGPLREFQYLFLRKIIATHHIYHCLSSYHPLFKMPIPSITTIHDLKYLKFPKTIGNVIKQIYIKFSFSKSILLSDINIAVSKKTKSDLLSFNCPQEKIRVVHEANPISIKNSEKVALPFKKFFLFVGENRPHKNIYNLLLAFKKFKSMELKKNRTGLLIVGNNTKQLAHYVDNHDKCFIFHEKLSTKKLVWCYKNALALIYPSFYEGFGLPILEAMSFGLPVITSKGTAAAEIANRSSLLIDPHDPNEISAALFKIFKSKVLRTKLKYKGLNNAKRFSWEKTAQATIITYRKLYKTYF